MRERSVATIAEFMNDQKLGVLEQGYKEDTQEPVLATP